MKTPSTNGISDPFYQCAVLDAWRVIRFGLWVVICLLGTAGLWLTFAPLNGAVIVNGSLIANGYRKTIQHLEGGIVTEIYVKAGDRVRVGQPLIRLAEVQASASVDILQGQLDTELVRASRLTAERVKSEQFKVPSDVYARARANPKLEAVIATERLLFQTRKEQLHGQVAALKSQINQVQEESIALEKRSKDAAKSAGLIGEELAMSEALRAKNFVQKNQVLGLRRTLSEKDEQLGEFQAQIAQSRQKVAELELRILTLWDAYMREATDELKDANRRILDLQERLRPNEDLLDRLIVRAPASGEIVDLRVTTVGGVVSPREVIAEILPENGGLIVEGKARVEDIAHIKAGDLTDVQLVAYKQRTMPLVAAKVSYISADSLFENIGGNSVPYFKIQAEIDEKSLVEAGSPVILPGMPAVLFVQTRARTALEYLLEPVTDIWRMSFKEF